MHLQKSWLKEEFVGCGQAGCPIFKELRLWTWEVTSFLTLYSRSQPVMGTSIRVWKALLCFSITGISNRNWVFIPEHFHLLQWCIKRTKDRKQCPISRKGQTIWGLLPSPDGPLRWNWRVEPPDSHSAQMPRSLSLWLCPEQHGVQPGNMNIPPTIPLYSFLASYFWFLVSFLNAITIKLWFPLDN